MACTNCFNGCAETISDKCVKYTGLEYLPLDIHPGDSLLSVEQKIIENILTLADGSGIIPILDQTQICEVVQELIDQVNCCLPLTLNDILNVYLQAICILDAKNEGLKDRIVTLETAVNALNANYTIGCLTGVTASSDTHDIVQAIITKLCSIETQLTLYVKKTELDGLIADYIAGAPGADLKSNKMVEYVAYPYYGLLTDFSATGEGTGVWDRVFLCNGDNGTPDLRGRTLVGATTMPGLVVMDPEVLPGGSNPAYTITTKTGSNAVSLTTASQLPPHTHSASVTINDPGHTHGIPSANGIAPAGGSESILNPGPTTWNTHISVTGLNGTGFGQNVFVTNATVGSSAPHPNIQPSRAAYFIMYIPL